MINPTWDDTFLALARELSKRSKDESTKVGAIVVGPDKEIRSVGYNSFPRGINDANPIRQLRPQKYFFMEHAERNCVYNAARVGIPLKGCVIYVPWVPCADCARAIIQVGITMVVTDNINVPQHWRDSFEASLEMLEEAGIMIRLSNDTRFLSRSDIFGTLLRESAAPCKPEPNG